MVEIRSASSDDLDGVWELLDARSRAAFGTSEVQLEHLRSAWEAPSFDLARNASIAVDDGRVVGYAAVDATQSLSLTAVDESIADELLRRVERSARDRGFDRVETTVVPEDQPLHDLVRHSRFELDHEIWRMWKHLSQDEPEPVWPGGVAVRTYTDADGERVHALLDDAYGGWDRDYVARSHDDWLKFMTDHSEFEPALWFLVERDTDLVAAGLHWKEQRGDGWVKDLVVREHERGRGLGTALLRHAFHEYGKRGAARVGLKVDPSNPTGAPRLYQATGFVTDRRYGVWVKRL